MELHFSLGMLLFQLWLARDELRPVPACRRITASAPRHWRIGCVETKAQSSGRVC